MALQPQSSRSRRSKSDLSNDLATYRDALPANKAVRQHLHDVRLTCATLRPRHAQHVGARAFQRRPRPFGANELCWPGAISVTFVVFPFRGYSLVPQHFINGARTFLPSNASIGTPSLYSSTLINGASTVESSVSTSLANHLAGFPTLDEVDGVLVQPQSEVRTPEYGCVFWFLNCPYLSWDKEEWAMHCLSHFRGKAPLVPCNVRCAIGRRRSTTAQKRGSFECTILRTSTLRSART